MTFAEVLPHLEAGRKVRRGLYVYFLGGIECEIPLDWLVASDWEVVEEPAKPDLSAVAMGLDAPTLRNERDGDRALSNTREGLTLESHGVAYSRLKKQLDRGDAPVCMSALGAHPVRTEGVPAFPGRSAATSRGTTTERRGSIRSEVRCRGRAAHQEEQPSPHSPRHANVYRGLRRLMSQGRNRRCSSFKRGTMKQRRGLC